MPKGPFEQLKNGEWMRIDVVFDSDTAFFKKFILTRDGAPGASFVLLECLPLIFYPADSFGIIAALVEWLVGIPDSLLKGTYSHLRIELSHACDKDCSMLQNITACYRGERHSSRKASAEQVEIHSLYFFVHLKKR